MRKVHSHFVFRIVVGLLACGWLMAGNIPVLAQAAVTTLSKPKIFWFGPAAISPNDTFQFNYTNLGVDPVLIEWAFSSSTTGELVCGNFGKPTRVEPGRGAEWKYAQPIVDGVERPYCENGDLRGGGVLEEGESYFNSDRRHGLVSWLFVQHTTARGEKLAVDLSTLELFNSMLMPDGSRAATFGRTMQVIHANPTAPTDYQLKLLGK